MYRPRDDVSRPFVSSVKSMQTTRPRGVSRTSESDNDNEHAIPCRLNEMISSSKTPDT